MLKSKLCAFAMATMLGAISLSPVTAFAADINTESVAQPEKKEDHRKQRAAYEEKMKKASEKWNTLNEKQKKEVYTLLEKELKANLKLMDKLAELGVFEKEDVINYKNHMQESYKKATEHGEFPLLMQKNKNKSK